MKIVLWYALDPLNEEPSHPDLANMIDEENLKVTGVFKDTLVVDIDSDKLDGLKKKYPYLNSSSQPIYTHT